MRWPLVAVVSLALTAALRANQTPSPDQQPPIFRAGIQLVEVDVTVTDGKGRPVRDLGRDDFELTEDGASQDVTSFRLVDIPIAPRQVRGDAIATSIDRDVSTNATSGRLYVMLLDNPAGAPWTHVYLTQRTARRFITQALAADDLMAIVDLQGGFGSHGFTSNRQQLLASIDRFGRNGLSGVEETFAVEQQSSALGTYEVMRYVAERLGSVGNRRKAIVWIGGIVPFHPVLASTAVAYRDAMRAATRNNVAIYPVDPHGLTIAIGRAELERVSALRAVAEDTGGYAVVNTNNFSGGYRRIVEQNSTYYVLGYYPAVERRDGRFHDIRVRVKRPGLTVRARRGYLAPPPGADASARRPLPDGLSIDALNALRSIVPVQGVSLEMFAAPFRGDEGLGSVLVGAQVRGADLTFDAENRMEISKLAFDSAGSIHGATRSVFAIDLRPEARQPVTNRGLRYFDRLTLPPGRHEVRLVVHQPGGGSGSVVAHVDVPDFSKTPLTMSGLVVASQDDATQPTLATDARATAALSMEPTMNRRFTRSDVLMLWAEVYDGRKTPAPLMRLTTRIASAAGQTAMARERLLPPGGAHDPGRFEYRDRVALAELAPGAYVLTVEAALSGARNTVRRDVPFTVMDETTLTN